MAVEVGSAYVSIIPSARGFGAAMSKELDVDGIAGSSGESAGARFSGGFIPHLAKIGAVAAAAAVAVGAVFGGKLLVGSIQAASDLNEAMSQVQFVFGDSAKEVQDWSKTAATGLGQSQRAALEAAGSLGNFFQGMGIAQVAAAEMSKGVVQLAGDIASFANISPDEALQALQSGLAGEVEPLRRFGISLDEVSLKQKAQQLGLGDGKAVLTAAAKAQAAYAIIMESSSRIQGDFARTSQGLANQQRIMSAQWINLKAEIGAGFLPVVAEAAAVINTKLLPALQKFAVEMGPKISTAIADFIATLRTGLAGDVVTPFEHAALVIRNFANTAIDAFKAIVAGFRGGFDGINVDGFADDIGRGVARVVNILGSIPGSISAFVQAFKSGNDDITSSGLNGTLENIANHVRDFFDLINNNRGIFDTIVAGFLGMATALVAAREASKGISLLSGGINALAALMPLLTSPVGIAIVAFAGLAAAAVVAYQKIPLVHDAVNSVVKAFKEGGLGAAVDEAGNQFGRLWDVVKPKFDEFLSNVWEWIKDKASSVGDTFATDWGPRLWDWIQNTAIPFLLEKLPAIVDTIIQWVKDNQPKISEAWSSAASSFWNWVQDVALPQLKEKLPIIIAALTQFAVENIPRWGALLGLLFLDAIGRLAVLFVPLIGQFIITFPQQMVLLGLAIIGGLAVGIGNAWGDKVVPFFTNLGSSILGFLSDAGSWLVSTGAAILNGLWNGIQTGAVAVADFFANLSSSVLNWIGSDPIGWLIGHGENLIRGLYNGIQNVIGDVISFFQNLPGNIISWLGGTGGHLQGQGGDFIHGLLNGIQNVIGDVISFFQNLPGNIISWLGGTGSILLSQGSDVINGLIDGINGAIGGIPGALGAIPGIVSGAVSGAASWLYGVGGDIIQGLIDGIEGAASGIAGAVQGAVDRAVSSIPGVGGILSKIPGLAVGGYVTKPTLAIVGESGPEYVIPADMWAGGVSPLPPAYAAGMPAAASSVTPHGPITQHFYNSNVDAVAASKELAWTMLVAGR